MGPGGALFATASSLLAPILEREEREAAEAAAAAASARDKDLALLAAASSTSPTLSSLSEHAPLFVDIDVAAAIAAGADVPLPGVEDAVVAPPLL